MTDNIPTFNAGNTAWAHDVLFQALLTQLIESKILEVDKAERVFDLALEIAKKERARAPDAEKLIQHVHDHLPWDKYYAWSAQEKQRKNPSEGN